MMAREFSVMVRVREAIEVCLEDERDLEEPLTFVDVQKIPAA